MPHPTALPAWQVFNDSPVWLRPRRMVYFISRRTADADGRQDLCDKAGRLRTWRTRAEAQTVADRVNSLEANAVNRETHPTARSEAVATADAHLSNVGLPTYSEALEALMALSDATQTTWRTRKQAADSVIAQHVRR